MSGDKTQENVRRVELANAQWREALARAEALPSPARKRIIVQIERFMAELEAQLTGLRTIPVKLPVSQSLDERRPAGSDCS